MADPLYISEEDPIELDGSLDAAGDLQLLHNSDSLADYDQTLHADHTDLNESTGVVRVKLEDFSNSGTTWTMSATHDPGTGTVAWSQGSDHVYYDFGPMSEELEIDVVATDDSTPPVTKSRQARIKIKPPDAQPDHPPA